MNNVFKIILPLLVMMVAASCERRMGEMPTQSKEFIPTVIGKYIVYDVDSMHWDNFTKTYTVKKMEMKYEFTDSFTNPAGDLSYVITVSKKDSGTTVFKPNMVNTITVTDNKVLYSSQNLTFINLAFPVSTNIYWDGLAMIDRDKNVHPEFYSTNWLYEYADIGSAFKSGTTTFKKTITVKHIDYQLNDPDVGNPSFAEKISSKEVYAENIGLVYKEFIYWEYQQTLGYRNGGGAIYKYKSSN